MELREIELHGLEKILKSIASISISTPIAFDYARGSSAATGFIVDKCAGYVLTNAHVAQRGPVVVTGKLYDYEEITLKCVYVDPIHDFAFLKFDPATVRSEFHEIELFPQGAYVGCPIVMIGNDSGEKITILPGYIGRLDRPAPHWDFNTFYYSAANNASGGSSGSPVLNKDYKAIALQSGGSTKAANNFFVPLDRVKYVLQLLQNQRTITRGDLGASFVHTSFDDIKKLGVPQDEIDFVMGVRTGAKGLLVVEKIIGKHRRVKPSFEVGDVLLAMDDVAVMDFVAMEDYIDARTAQSVTFTVHRRGQKLIFNYLVTDILQLESLSVFYFGGFTVRGNLYRDYLSPVPGGVIVTECRDGLKQDDFILEINNTPTNSIAEFESAIVRLLNSALSESKVKMRVKYSQTSMRNKVECKTFSLHMSKILEYGRFEKDGSSGQWSPVTEAGDRSSILPAPTSISGSGRARQLAWLMAKPPLATVSTFGSCFCSKNSRSRVADVDAVPAIPAAAGAPVADEELQNDNWGASATSRKTCQRVGSLHTFTRRNWIELFLASLLCTGSVVLSVWLFVHDVLFNNSNHIGPMKLVCMGSGEMKDHVCLVSVATNAIGIIAIGASSNGLFSIGLVSNGVLFSLSLFSLGCGLSIGLAAAGMWTHTFLGLAMFSSAIDLHFQNEFLDFDLDLGYYYSVWALQFLVCFFDVECKPVSLYTSKKSVSRAVVEIHPTEQLTKIPIAHNIGTGDIEDLASLLSSLSLSKRRSDKRCGFVVDAERGLVIARSKSVPHGTLYLYELTVSHAIEPVPAELIFVHPEHGYSILKYDPQHYNLEKVVVGQFHVQRDATDSLSYRKLGSYPSTILGAGYLLCKDLESVMITEHGELVGINDDSAYFESVNTFLLEGLPNQVPIFPAKVNRVDFYSRVNGFSVPQEWRKRIEAEAKEYKRQHRIKDKYSKHSLLYCVESVLPLTTAAQILKVDDVILEINGKMPFGYFAMARAIEESPSPCALSMKVLRAGEIITIDKLALPSRPTIDFDEILIWAGLMIRPVDDAVLYKFGYDPPISMNDKEMAQGLYAYSFVKGFVAAKPDVHTQTILLEVNDVAICSIDELLRFLHSRPELDCYRVRVIDKHERMHVFTLRKDLSLFPTTLYRRSASEGWERTAFSY